MATYPVAAEAAPTDFDQRCRRALRPEWLRTPSRLKPLLRFSFAEVLELFYERLRFQFQVVVRPDGDTDVAAPLKTAE